MYPSPKNVGPFIPSHIIAIILSVMIATITGSCGSYPNTPESDLHQQDTQNYRLILEELAIELGQPVPPHVRYRQNVPLDDITTTFVFKLCEYDPQTFQIIPQRCIYPFYDAYGPLVLNRYTLNTIKDPLEKLGLILEQGMQLTFDTYGLIVDHPVATGATAATITAAGIGSYYVVRSHQKWSYQQLIAFTKTPEFQAVKINPSHSKLSPQHMLKAIFQTGAYKKNPQLIRASTSVAAQMIAQKGWAASKTMGLTAVLTAGIVLAGILLMPEQADQFFHNLVRRVARKGHDFGNHLISKRVRNQLQSGPADPDFMQFAITYNERHIFSEHPSSQPPKLSVPITTLIPALAQYLALLKKPYEVKILRYCLPETTPTTSFSFGALSQAISSQCVDI